MRLVPERTDGYDGVAEFYDLVAVRQSRSSGPALARRLRLLPEHPAPVLEVGAGTGRVTRTILAARSDLSVLALEPSAPMRAILTSRLWPDESARERVTVLAERVPGAPLPPRLLAAVLFGVAGHLDEEERRALFADLAARLVPGGFLAVELMGSVRELAPARTLCERVGELCYEWWVSGVPIGPETMRFRNVWRVLRGGEVLRELVDEHRWQVLDADRLAAESGLRVDGQTDEEHGGRVVFLSR